MKRPPAILTALQLLLLLPLLLSLTVNEVLAQSSDRTQNPAKPIPISGFFNNTDYGEFVVRNPFRREPPNVLRFILFGFKRPSIDSVVQEGTGIDRLVYRVTNSTGDSSSTFAVTKSIETDTTLELMMIWRNIHAEFQSQQYMCVYFGFNHSLFWQATTIDHDPSPSMDLRADSTLKTQDFARINIDSQRNLLENLLMNQAGFGIMIDDLQAFKMRDGTFKKNNMICFQFSPYTYLNSGSEPPWRAKPQQLKFRILMAENMREVHRSAVLAGHIPRHEAARLPDTVLAHPFWPVGYKTITLNPAEAKQEAAKLSAKLDRLSDFIGSYHLLYNLPVLESNDPNKQPTIETFANMLTTIGACRVCRVLLQVYPEKSTNLENYFLTFNLTAPVGFGFASSDDAYKYEPDSANELVYKYYDFIPSYIVQRLLGVNRRLVGDESRLIIATNMAFRMQTLPLLMQLPMQATGDKRPTILRRVLINSQIASLAGYQYPQPLIETFGVLPDVELYVRWIQTITFLPSMAIPAVPWDYAQNDSNNVAQLVKDLVRLHRNVAMPEIEKHSPAWLNRGEPLVRPVWYAEPDDMDCFEAMSKICESEFMLGPDLLVAPVVELGAIYIRHIYLPRGCWRGGWNNETYPGHREFQISVGTDLRLLPYFVRQSSSC